MNKYWTSIKRLKSQILHRSIPLWLLFILVVLIILIFIIILIVIKFKKKAPRGYCLEAQNTEKPRHIHQTYPDYKHFGVIWRICAGNDMLGDEDRLWVDDPFCPVCDYQLDTADNGKKWICNGCNRKFKIPKGIREDTKGKMIKILEAILRNRSDIER